MRWLLLSSTMMQALRLPRLVSRDEKYTTVVHPTGTVGADRYDAMLARSCRPVNTD